MGRKCACLPIPSCVPPPAWPEAEEPALGGFRFLTSQRRACSTSLETILCRFHTTLGDWAPGMRPVQGMMTRGIQVANQPSNRATIRPQPFRFT